MRDDSVKYVCEICGATEHVDGTAPKGWVAVRFPRMGTEWDLCDECWHVAYQAVKTRKA